MVVAQLVERLFPIPEVRGSNPVIGKIYWTIVYCIEKTKIKKKGPKWPIFKKKLVKLIKYSASMVPNNCFFKKWANLGLFLFIFGLFNQTIQFFYKKSMWKISKCPSSIWCRDSNQRPFKHESSPITTGPRLPPKTFWMMSTSRYL